MNVETNFEGLEVGFDVPALPGMDEADIQTPCLILDLGALERNVKKMGDLARDMGVRHRAHGKMHKSVDVAKLQETLGHSVGVCCQKVSEAEVFARGGIKDVWCPIRCVIQPRSTALHGCQNWVRGFWFV